MTTSEIANKEYPRTAKELNRAINRAQQMFTQQELQTEYGTDPGKKTLLEGPLTKEQNQNVRNKLFAWAKDDGAQEATATKEPLHQPYLVPGRHDGAYKVGPGFREEVQASDKKGKFTVAKVPLTEAERAAQAEQPAPNDKETTFDYLSNPEPDKWEPFALSDDQIKKATGEFEAIKAQEAEENKTVAVVADSPEPEDTGLTTLDENLIAASKKIATGVSDAIANLSINPPPIEEIRPLPDNPMAGYHEAIDSRIGDVFQNAGNRIITGMENILLGTASPTSTSEKTIEPASD